MPLFWKHPLKALPVLLLLAAYAGAAFGAAGKVQFVIGDVKLITRAGVTQDLQKGAEINEGDRVITATGASAQIKMVDGGFIAIRPNTDMGFDTYRYSGKEDGSENAIVSLLRGGFRTITGVIGRTNKQNYMVKTATATIGIRGTDHEPMVILAPLPGQAAIAAPGTYDKVNVGIAFIRNEAGSVDIHRNQVGFAPETKAPPVVLPRIPPFYKPTPAPGPQKAKEEAKDEGKKESQQTAAAPARAGEEQKAAAPAEAAAEPPAPIRTTAIVDPTSTVSAAPAATTEAVAPVALAPVVAITATDSSGTVLNTTTQTQTTSSGITTPISETTPVTPPPVVPPPVVQPVINSPLVAAGNYGFGGLASIPITGGVELASFGSPAFFGSLGFISSAANTNFVLSDNNLVEIRQSPYERFGLSSAASTFIANADIKFSGGTAADTISDPNGTYYMGRWSGGQIAVTDLATTSPVTPFADALGTSSVHWLVGLTPGNVAGTSVNNVQQLVGTASYTLTAATHPTDGLGNVGTLNSASLTADFSAQTVDSSLNLSFSSADPVNRSQRNLSLTASANKMPIQQSGFGGAVISPFAGGFGNTVTCTGADCAVDGYFGSIGGAFLASASGGSTSGAVGTGVGLNYGFTAIPASTSTTNQPFADFITGAAVLGTAAAPTAGVSNFSTTAVLQDEVRWPTTQIFPGVDPAMTTYIVSDKNRENLFNNLGGTAASPVTITGPTNSTNFLFDASGNLVRVLDTPHVVFDHGRDVPGTTNQFTAPTPLAHAQLSFGGGGATASENYFDPATSVRFGRWTGGVVNVTDLATGDSFVESLAAPGGGNRSVQWLVAQTPSSLPVTGEFHYTRIGDASGTPSFATAPTDSYGNVGTLNGARLSADFTNLTASAGVRISMPSGPAGSLGIQNLSSFFESTPITGGGFNVSSGADNPAGSDSLHVSCFGPGCASNQNYGGRIRGAFSSATGGATADGGFFRYTFNTNYTAAGAGPVPAGRVVDDYIDGLVAFKQGPQIVLPTAASGVYSLTAPTAPVTALTTYAYDNAGNRFVTHGSNWVDRPSSANLTLDASGNLVSITDDNDEHGNSNAITLSGGTPSPSAPISLAIGSAATATDGTILLGWQVPAGLTALTVSGTDFNGCFGTVGCAANPAPRTVLSDGLSWVRGPAPFPDYLPGAIAGHSNVAGVFSPATATYNLGASILHDQTGAAGTVNSATLGVNFDRASVDFAMAATAGANSWTASASNIRLHQQGEFNAFTPGGAVTTFPTTPAGTNINTHDSLTVTLNGSGSNTFGDISGQLMGIGLGGAGVTYNLNNFSCGTPPCPSASGALAFSNAQPFSTLTAYQLVAFAAGMNAAGQVDSNENHRIQGGFVSPFRTKSIDNFPVQIDGEFPVVVSQSCAGCINVNDIPVVYAVAGASGPASIGTATLLESGFDAATGIRWGRYGSGTIGVNDRITGAALGTIDVTTQNSHLIMSSVQSGPTVLPLTGTFSYTFAGGTRPTDSNGNVGAALTAANASLTANFTTQKVDAALSNLVVGGATWSASAAGMPIIGNVFGAEKKLGGGGLLTVTSTLGTDTAGSLAGAFTGPTGNGVGMLYSLNRGGNPAGNPGGVIPTNPAAVTVSGVAAFRR